MSVMANEIKSLIAPFKTLSSDYLIDMAQSAEVTRCFIVNYRELDEKV